MASFKGTSRRHAVKVDLQPSPVNPYLILTVAQGGGRKCFFVVEVEAVEGRAFTIRLAGAWDEFEVTLADDGHRCNCRWFKGGDCRHTEALAAMVEQGLLRFDGTILSA